MNYKSRGFKTLNEFSFKDPFGREKTMVKAKVKKTLVIPDGKHKGIIQDCEVVSNKGFEYFEIFIKMKDPEVTLKVGVPFSITQNSQLGQILKNFGAILKDNQEIETDSFLKKDLDVEFLTLTESTDRGVFAKIIPNTLKPLK